MENKKQLIELADIFRASGENFLKTHNLCVDQLKAFYAIENCRTFALGGHMDQCDSCGYTKQSYNSCRNRHCPKCQSTKKLQWVDKLAANLPPVKHFHVVFTIPDCLNAIFYLNQGKAYSLLFKAVDFATLKTACYLKNWVVYCQKPFAGPEGIIRYLGNYTHRVAISNHRIEAFEKDKVTFSYKDYKTGSQQKNMTLEVNEFIRRFLQHILPSGFYKIRYFGILALCNMKSKMETCFSLIENNSYFSVLEGLNSFEVLRIITGKDPMCCPKCQKGKMIPHAIEIKSLVPG